MNFGERLAAVRKERGMSQKDLSALLEINPVMLSRYENSQMNPSLEIAARIAKGLGVSLDFLVFGEDEGERTVDERLMMFDRLGAREQEYVLAVLEAFVVKNKFDNTLESNSCTNTICNTK